MRVNHSWLAVDLPTILIVTGEIKMGKVIFTLVVTLVVGLVSMVLGIEFFGGYPELGAIVSIAVASGLIVYFNNKKK